MSIHTGVKRWRQTLVTKHFARSLGQNRPAPARQIRSAARAGLSVAVLTMSFSAAHAAAWVPLNNQAPTGIALMELLSDGTVIAQSAGVSAQWFRLTPDILGSYVNGSWSSIASMNDTRLYGSTAVMPDGRVFYAGAEYGTGANTAETYDPITNIWTRTPDAGQHFSDSVSTVLPNGNVLVGPVGPSVYGGTSIFNYLSNTWTAGPTYVRGGYQDEASWVKLPDDSVLTIDPFGTNSERYIPSLGRWVDDGVVPTPMYDSQGELGAAFLLPTGKAFYIGATGHTALYTPSGDTTPGVWAAGPDVPNGHGPSDAAAAMMRSGSILCAVGSPGSFNAPTFFYEYNPYTNSFAQVNGPTGVSDNVVPYGTRMLDLPDGNVLYANSGSTLYLYSPDGGFIQSARPIISTVAPNADGSFLLTGARLTGISEGAAYGDDAQMATNYPIVYLIAGNQNIYYARSFNWSSTGVMKNGNQTTQFTVPNSVPTGDYLIGVVTNGIPATQAPFQVANVTALTVAPASVVAGSSTTGTVTVSPSAPVGGTMVHLDVSDPASASVPAIVTIPGGATSTNFTVSTPVRFSHTAVTINAVRGGTRQSATLNIASTTGIASLTISPSSVAAGAPSKGIVTISQAAPIGGRVITLTSSSPSAVSVPPTVTVPAGSTTANFPITTFLGHPVLGAVITGSLNGDSQSAKISVTQTTVLTSLTITPGTIAAGGTATGKVTLSIAPTAGTWISLSSSDLFNAHVYSGVSVRAGYTTATFPIAVRAGAPAKTVTITATYRTVSKSAPLVVTAP